MGSQQIYHDNLRKGGVHSDDLVAAEKAGMAKQQVAEEVEVAARQMQLQTRRWQCCLALHSRELT